jgi:hypothetical protein
VRAAQGGDAHLLAGQPHLPQPHWGRPRPLRPLLGKSVKRAQQQPHKRSTSAARSAQHTEHAGQGRPRLLRGCEATRLLNKGLAARADKSAPRKEALERGSKATRALAGGLQPLS